MHARVLDGVDQLSALLVGRARYPSVVAALAEHAVFLHPDTVAQTQSSALFPIVRSMARRGEFGTLSDGRRVLFDDNTAPTQAFLWSAGLSKGREVQFNHIWTESSNPDAYTALWNLCATPAFLAKTTDGSNYPEVTAALRFHAYRLFGVLPAGESAPTEPDGYGDLRWPQHPEPLRDLQTAIRDRLRSVPKSRTAIACREIGWLFSDWGPDPTI